MLVQSALSLPATRPPTSEWWARLATNPTSRSSWKTGLVAVRSGRCEPPPMYGSLVRNTSPGLSSCGGYRRVRLSTIPSIDPK